MNRLSLVQDRVFTVALVLAAKGYEAENPGCHPDAADAYAVAHYHLYVEDAVDLLVERGLAAKR